MSALRQCPHGFHHPMPGNLDYPHSCDGCWCEGERDRRDYGWAHSSGPGGEVEIARPDRQRREASESKSDRIAGLIRDLHGDIDHVAQHGDLNWPSA